MTHTYTFDSEVSLHSWLLWPTVRRRRGRGGCRRQDGQGHSVEKLGLEQGRFSPWLVYNITCLCSKATKGLGAPLRAYVGAKFLGWPIVPSSMGAYYRTGSPLLESLTLT